jgi:hypothetical protein
MLSNYTSYFWRIPLFGVLTAIALIYSAVISHSFPERVFLHESHVSWQIQTSIVVLVTLTLLLVVNIRPFVIGAAIAGAGAAANLLASFMWRDGTPDYFSYGDRVFNLADVFISVGLGLALISLPSLSIVFYCYFAKTVREAFNLDSKDGDSVD